MIDTFAIDASIAVAWVHPAQATADSTAWLERVAAGSDIIVPSIWSLEVSNALLVLERRRKLTRPERAEALRFLGALPVTYDHEGSGRPLAELANLAAQDSLSVYDASYLDLAMRRGLRLGCRDGPLRTAAIRHGVSLDPSG